ncbi:MAG: hypothetical protein WBF33_11260 [Candidatus Nitrosopolaris sp.]
MTTLELSNRLGSTFDKIAGTTTTALELYNKRMKLYPDRVNPGALWRSAQAVKG